MNFFRVGKSEVRGARLGCISLAIALGLSPALQAQPVGIPSMGAASSAELSPMLEDTLGDAIMEQGRRDPTYIDDPDVGQYLTDLAAKLVAHAPEERREITVFGVRDPQINAFALPGGYIGVNSGLVVSAQNESQLASVIAHEIGHVLQRHIARGMTAQSQNSGVAMAALAGALLAALAGSGDLAMGVAAFGQAAAVDRQLGFSRQAEQESDRAGLQMLQKAGFDPKGMVDMFGQLMNSSRLNEGAGGGAYASTHPLSIQRMSDIENRVRAAPASHHRDSPEFWYIRARLRVLQARGSDAQRDAMRRLQLDSQQLSGVPRSAAWYGLAYLAWSKRDFAQADTALQKAQENGVYSSEIARLAVSLALSRGDTARALTLAQSAWSRWPQRKGVALSVIEAMQKGGADQAAVDFIAQRLKEWPEMPRLYELQAQSFERLNKKIEARRAMAAYYEKTGALPTAVEQLRQARALSRDFYVQSELDVQIRNLRQRLESQRELLKRFKS